MSILYNFQNKNFIVTGASSGIGRQIVVDLAKNGANVFALARRKDKLDELRNLFPDKIRVTSLDVTNLSGMTAILEQYCEATPIDGSVHAAGIFNFTTLRNVNFQDFEIPLKTSLLAGIELIRVVSKKKHSASQSSHVQISSVAGIKGQVGFTAYAAAKGAMIAAVRCLALELAPRNIRVNAISPGWVETEMTEKIRSYSPESYDRNKQMHPLGLGTPVDISNAAQFLLSDEARWITGINLTVDGGFCA